MFGNLTFHTNKTVIRHNKAVDNVRKRFRAALYLFSTLYMKIPLEAFPSLVMLLMVYCYTKETTSLDTQ